MIAIVNPNKRGANIAPAGMPYFSVEWLESGDRYQTEQP